MIRCALTTFFTLALTACGIVDHIIIADGPPKIVVTEQAIEQDLGVGHLDHFVLNYKDYTIRLIEHVSSDLYVDPETLEFLEVSLFALDEHDVALGYFHQCCTIGVAVYDRSLSAYGHELVRALLFHNGHWKLAFQSSLDWSGLPGVLWNKAETLSLEYY